MDEDLREISQKPGGSPNRLRTLLAFHKWLEDLKTQEKKDEHHAEEN